MEGSRTISEFLRGMAPLIWVSGGDESAVLRETADAAHALHRRLFVWTRACGLCEGAAPEPAFPPPPSADPVAALERFAGLLAPSVLVMLGGAQALGPLAVRLLRDLFDRLWEGHKSVLIVGDETVPGELKGSVAVAHPPQWHPALLDDALARLEAALGPLPWHRRLLCEEAKGLPREAILVALGTAARGGYDPAGSLRLARASRPGGLLEHIKPGVDWSAVGGLSRLKEFMATARRAMGEKAARHGIAPPRGVLLLGPPGCGKSLCARATAAGWGLPLLRLDLGAMYEAALGASERNLREALAAAQATAPAVLWLDEADMSLAGVASSDRCDAGTAARVIATLASWLSMRPPGLFVVACANSPEAIPARLLRKGRFDEVFFLDLPGEGAREEIFRVHLSRRGRDPEAFDLAGLARATEGFSGAEIEACVERTLLRCFVTGRKPDSLELASTAASMRPLALARREETERLRRSCARIAVPAEEERCPA